MWVEHVLFVAGYATHFSLKLGPPVLREFNTGTVVKVFSASPGPVAAALTDAAALWNLYYPHSSSAVNVHGVSVDAYDTANENVIGTAGCNADYCRLTVKSSLTAQQMFDVFVHEIGHAIIPRSAETATGRIIDPESGHWAPYETDEIFSPYITSTPFMALYTAQAVNPHSIACTITSNCRRAGDECRSLPGNYRNVPGWCVPRAAAHNYDPPGALPSRSSSAPLFPPLLLFFLLLMY